MVTLKQGQSQGKRSLYPVPLPRKRNRTALLQTHICGSAPSYQALPLHHRPSKRVLALQPLVPASSAHFDCRGSSPHEDCCECAWFCPDCFVSIYTTCHLKQLQTRLAWGQARHFSETLLIEYTHTVATQEKQLLFVSCYNPCSIYSTDTINSNTSTAHTVLGTHIYSTMNSMV